MKRKVLKDKTAAAKNETTAALQTLYDALNQGQKKKVLKSETVAALFERYGVVTVS